MTRLLALVLTALALLPAAPAADACTTFRLRDGDRFVVGKSYDWDMGPGIVLGNKRGVAKHALILDLSAKPAEWTSRYGSVTFNQYGREMPNGGMNEVGLVVEIMWLSSTTYPRQDERPVLNELQLIQYLLDTCATMADVKERLAMVRVARIYANVHYMACDRTGACMAIEYLDGKLAITPPDRMTPPVLTNDTYADSVAYLATTQKPAPEGDRGSLSRFARAAGMIGGKRRPGSLDTEAFAVLGAVAQGNYSKWNIVYDPIGLKVWFRTTRTPKIKTVELGKLDPSCTSAVKLLDIDADFAGDATGRFVDYTTAANEQLVSTTLAPLKDELPPFAVTLLARFPDTMRCAPAR